MRLINNTYNKIVRKTEGKLFEEKMRRDYFKQVAKRYFSLCYDAKVKERMIDDLSNKIFVSSSYGVHDEKLISLRNAAYTSFREISRKKKLSEMVIINSVKTAEDACLLMNKAREVREEKDMKYFFYEFNKIFLHGALFGIAIWCVDACITVFSMESRNIANVFEFCKNLFSSMPFALLMSTGVSFLYHLNRYSKISKMIEDVFLEVCKFVNSIDLKNPHKNK